MSKNQAQTHCYLIGKPNVGKSTIFNQLTGKQAPTGNRSGVTIEECQAPLIDNKDILLTDLPGIDFFDSHPCEDHPKDQKITLAKLQHLGSDERLLLVLDGTKLQSQLYLALQILELGLKTLIIVHQGQYHQKKLLSQQLGVTVLLESEIQTKNTWLKDLLSAKKSKKTNIFKEMSLGEHKDQEQAEKRYQFIATMLGSPCVQKRNYSDLIDTLALNKYLGLPLFFLMMYLTFSLTVVLGSTVSPIIEALVGTLSHSAFFLAKSTFLEPICASLCSSLVTISSFIAPLFLLYSLLGVLEESGYMQRAACVIDRAMRKLKLPGQSFIPILVGFGCNVPAIMSSRTINFEQDRIQTILMSPFMSCSARLAIFSVFASSFFGQAGAGHGIIFCLYLLGFLIALLTGFVVRYVLGSRQTSCLIQEVSAYRVPALTLIVKNSSKKILRFLFKAGQIIIPATLFIHFIMSFFPTALYSAHPTLISIFSPMGLEAGQSPAIFSLFSGMLAKEVIIGSLEAFQMKTSLGLTLSPSLQLETLYEAVRESLSHLHSLSFLFPLKSEITISHQGYLQEIFSSKHAAISYMIFVLLYFPCLSVTATIAKESHKIWAIFSSLWSTVIAYICAVFYFQIATYGLFSASHLSYLGFSILTVCLCITWLKHQVKKLRRLQIPIKLKAF